MIKYRELTNGLKILFVPSPSYSIHIVVASHYGFAHESDRSRQITHLVEHILALGGSKLFSSEIEMKRTLDRMSGGLSGETSANHVKFCLSLAKKEQNLGLNLIFDSLLNPIIDEQKIEKEKQSVASDLAKINDNMDLYTQFQIQRIIFEGHPYGWQIITPFNRIKNLRKSQIEWLAKRLMRPNHLVVVVAGSFDEEKAFSTIEKYFGKLKPMQGRVIPPFVLTQTKPKLVFEPRRAKQIAFSIGFPIFGFFDKDYYALSILKNIICGRQSSILDARLCCEKGLVYTIQTDRTHWRDAGYFEINAATWSRRNMWKIYKIVLDTIVELRETLISKDELDLAKVNLSNFTRRQFDDEEHVANFYAEQLIYYGTYVSLREYLREIKKVNRFDVRRVARRVFDFSHLNLHALGRVLPTDEEKILEMLKKYNGRK